MSEAKTKTARQTGVQKGIDGGREDLAAWKAAQPDNAYTADEHFQRVLALYADERLGPIDEDLRRFGAEVAGPLDELVAENNLHTNLPRLERYDGIGRRVETIAHHPTYHQAGRYIYGSGVMEAYADHPNALGALARFYVSSWVGEGGHNCPLACTAGVIRVLQELGDEPLKERFLGGFLDRDYAGHLEGAQFLTEVQGGSDVGSNETRAVQADDGTWRITGEKWFCSNIDADVFLMTARPDDAPEGTRGLGLFLVPRRLDDGQVNGFEVRRLKDKLGTRSMASGEVDFSGALAYHMGEVDEGFKNMMRLVINTSRLYNSVGCAQLANRAYAISRGYADHRRAFGHAIIDYPLVQETLATHRAETDAMVSGVFHAVWLQDRLDRGEADEVEQGFLRMAINLNKTRTAKTARWACVEGIEILGGNGAIETFSALPRMLRDAIVYENWEGTHNTLIMQMYRDMKKYRVHEACFTYLSRLLDDGVAKTHAEELGEALSQIRERLEAALSLAPEAAPLVLRPLLDEVAYRMWAVVRAWEQARHDEVPAWEKASFEHFLDTRVRDEVDRAAADYITRLPEVARPL